ncbi:MAG: T9SS type A sorting domain-containing protein, partial [Bacteroidales bacterium]|nr:T9SS type A sorting domain-containing protein [Bacteroidales bacterium]
GTNSTFNYSPIDGDQVQVVMTSSLTCVTGNPASSNVIAMTVSNSLPASVSISATQNSVCQGNSVTFTAFPVNGGATPSYQWKVNGQNAGTNSTFNYSPIDGDQVQVVMTSSLTCVTGNPASSNFIAMTVSAILPASVSISATQSSVCQGTSVTFTAFPENGGATPSYQWKVNGQNAGTNNSTFNYSPINGDQVQVVMTSSLTCVTGNPASSNVIAMTVNPVVLSVLANPSTAGTAIYSGTPIIGQTVLLTAEPQSGWLFVNWTNNLGEVLSTNASFNFNVSGCNPIITANFNSGTALTGKLAYFNNVETRIPSPYNDGAFYARIFDGAVPVSAVQQLSNDMPFSFNDLETGKSYTMRLWEETTNNLIGQTWSWNNWGGVTALDALIVSYMAVENPVLSAFPWILPVGEQHYTPFFTHVADANNSTSITSLDALILLYRSIGDPMTIPFPGGRHNFQVAGKRMTTLNEMAYPTAPDVIFVPNGVYMPSSQATSVFYEAQLPVIETGANIFNIYMVATGDLNVSHNLGNTAKAHSDLGFEGVIAANVGDEILIPVRINQQAELGAITIGMSYNKQLIDVVDVIGYDIFNINKNAAEVHIAWFDQNGRSFGQNQDLVVLKAKVLAEINAGTRFAELISTTEFANVTANVLQDISLSTSYVETSVTTVDDLNAMSLNHSIFPNPFNDVTNIHYTLPAAGKVSVVVYNHLGQEVKTLFSGTQLAGAHSLRLNNYDLNGSGTYFYRIMLEGETKTISARGTIMMAK